MSAPRFRLLVIGADPVAGLSQGALDGFDVEARTTLEQAHRFDAVLVVAASAAELAEGTLPELRPAAAEAALVVVAPDADGDAATLLLQSGVQDVLPPGDAAALARALRHAVQRKRLERAARTAYATDLGTGLPHQAQLLEHMSHLLALRAREPQPMALLVLRVQGRAQVASRLGDEAANVLRRKVAVRLRSALRASDVVAAVDPDSFGILLARLESASDAERVAGKLVKVLRQPFAIAGGGQTVAVSVGMALVPEHGDDALALLRRAMAQAGSASAGGGEATPAVARDLGRAANDEER